MGQDSEKMDLTATQQYFKDIGVNLEDVSCFLALAVVNCMSIGEISKEGFVDGCTGVFAEGGVKDCHATGMSVVDFEVGGPGHFLHG